MLNFLNHKGFDTDIPCQVLFQLRRRRDDLIGTRARINSFLSIQFNSNSSWIQDFSIQFNSNSILIQIGFRIFQFNSNSIHFLSIPIQFNWNFMHRNKQISQIIGYFKFNLNISSTSGRWVDVLGINHMVANTQIFRILIITDAGAQLKTFWNVFDWIDKFHNCGRS